MILMVDTMNTSIIDIRIMNINPDVAESILKGNINNRNLRKRVVDSYARDMAGAKWSFNGIPIIIDENGNLKDGQHRLQAIVQSGITMKMLIITIKSCDAKQYDNNASRKVYDRFKMGEYEGIDKDNKYLTSNSCPAIANFALNAGRDVKATPNEIAEYVIKHENAIEYAVKNRASTRGLGNVGVWAAIAMAYESGYNRELLDSFCKTLKTGITDNKALYPCIKLRNYLIEGHDGGRQLQKDIFGRTQYALNAVEKGNSTATCKIAVKDYYLFND